MSYKDQSWHEYKTSFLRTFDTQVPIYSPSVYREFRGEIFTTFHSMRHPVVTLLSDNMNVHSRFSKSYAGVLRGLHYDNKTWKLVQAVVGNIYLIVLDVRENSTTYGKWESYMLTEQTRDQVLIPPGFANGHFAVTDCIFHYTMFYNGDYVDEQEQGIVKWNDPKFNIDWPTLNPILQKRDQ
jgi:dTDP-4-dehydrorhamnose 3,5-epimerase